MTINQLMDRFVELLGNPETIEALLAVEEIRATQ